MRNTKSKIIIVMCIAICLMVVGYAAFSTSLSITGTSNIASQWNVVFTKIEEASKTSGVTIINSPTASGTSATFNVGLALPGDKIVYRITIENKGTLDAKVQNIVASASDSPAIIYSMSGIQIGEEIKKQTTKTFDVTIEYDPNVTSQPEKTNKTLTVDITIVQSAGASSSTTNPSINQPLYLSSAILRDNIAYADNVSSPYVTASTGINFSAISSDTNGKGLYYTSTNTENNKPTYYFRGAVTNNYVRFGQDSSRNDLYWKIIRINEDGSIRIIYNGTSTTATGNDVAIGTSKFNENRNDNAYVGYMYGAIGSSTYAATHANTNNSTIKTVIDNWYNSNLSSYSSYLADAGFCNDRSVASTSGTWDSDDTALGYGTNTTIYGAYNRLYTNKKPQFACPNASNDLFTTSTSSKGNKALTVPIGLITADEVWYAGATTSSNNTYYLYTGAYYWPMSPRYFVGSVAFEWRVSSDGYLNLSDVLYNVGVRPVANLQSGVEITGGDGTSGNPYVIKTN